jgi:hypothetical protein
MKFAARRPRTTARSTPVTTSTTAVRLRPRPARAQIVASLLLVSLGVVLLTVFGGSASATTTAAGGKVHVYEVAPSLASRTANDVITGAITDHGKDYEGVAGNGTINRIVLSKGSFEISTTRITPNPPVINHRTCAVASSFSATVPIVKGTGRGAYAGVSGKFKVTITQVEIAPTRKNHTCNLSPNATPVAGVSWTKGSGTVSLK